MTPNATRTRVRAAIWLPGLLVAVGAAVATAHGLFEVATAAGAPSGIAGLYPLITDGLALVAYASTTQLVGPGLRYAWSVVVIAAGLSGLAQAAYLAGGVATASAMLRFGVGAWPAVAAAVAAHLLYLITTAGQAAPVQPEHTPGVRPDHDLAVQTSTAASVQPAHPSAVQTGEHRAPAEQLNGFGAIAKARDRALGAARRHAHEVGQWPTVSVLQALAAVSRGTAASALQQLRSEPPTGPDNGESSTRS